MQSPSSQVSVPALGSSPMLLAFHANPFGFCVEQKSFKLKSFSQNPKGFTWKAKRRRE